MKFGLQIARSSTTGNNFHALLTFIRRRRGMAIAAWFIVIIKNNDLTEGFFKLIALLIGFVAPLFEFGKGDTLNLGPSLHPTATFEQLVVICIRMTNMGDNSKLHSTSQ